MTLGRNSLSIKQYVYWSAIQVLGALSVMVLQDTPQIAYVTDPVLFRSFYTKYNLAMKVRRAMYWMRYVVGMTYYSYCMYMFLHCVMSYDDCDSTLCIVAGVNTTLTVMNGVQQLIKYLFLHCALKRDNDVPRLSLANRIVGHINIATHCLYLIIYIKTIYNGVLEPCDQTQTPPNCTVLWGPVGQNQSFVDVYPHYIVCKPHLFILAGINLLVFYTFSLIAVIILSFEVFPSAQEITLWVSSKQSSTLQLLG
ncbi:protein ORF31 [Lake sturgeon herpesvirus]|nr:protein ORF31 [Lake sturgeon herpesvirus]